MGLLTVEVHHLEIVIGRHRAASRRDRGAWGFARNVLQRAFEMMRFLAEGWKVTLSGVAPQVDSRMIQLFSCPLVKDITRIRPVTYLE